MIEERVQTLRLKLLRDALAAAEAYVRQLEAERDRLREELRVVTLERDTLLRHGVPRAGVPDFGRPLRPDLPASEDD